MNGKKSRYKTEKLVNTGNDTGECRLAQLFTIVYALVAPLAMTSFAVGTTGTDQMTSIG